MNQYVKAVELNVRVARLTPLHYGEFFCEHRKNKSNYLAGIVAATRAMSRKKVSALVGLQRSTDEPSSPFLINSSFIFALIVSEEPRRPIKAPAIVVIS